MLYTRDIKYCTYHGHTVSSELVKSDRLEVRGQRSLCSEAVAFPRGDTLRRKI